MTEARNLDTGVGGGVIDGGVTEPSRLATLPPRRNYNIRNRNGKLYMLHNTYTYITYIIQANLYTFVYCHFIDIGTTGNHRY